MSKTCNASQCPEVRVRHYHIPCVQAAQQEQPCPRRHRPRHQISETFVFPLVRLVPGLGRLTKGIWPVGMATQPSKCHPRFKKVCRGMAPSSSKSYFQKACTVGVAPLSSNFYPRVSRKRYAPLKWHLALPDFTLLVAHKKCMHHWNGIFVFCILGVAQSYAPLELPSKLYPRVAHKRYALL